MVTEKTIYILQMNQFFNPKKILYIVDLLDVDSGTEGAVFADSSCCRGRFCPLLGQLHSSGYRAVQCSTTASPTRITALCCSVSSFNSLQESVMGKKSFDGFPENSLSIPVE